jgi:hypothetical protein
MLLYTETRDCEYFTLISSVKAQPIFLARRLGDKNIKNLDRKNMKGVRMSICVYLQV